MNNLLLSLSLSFNAQADIKHRVQAVLELTNKDIKTMSVNTRFVVNTLFSPSLVRDISFQIIGPKEKQEFGVKINPPLMDYRYITELGQGESAKKTVFLDRYYQFFDKGEYCVKAIYENKLDFNETALWKGRVESNNVCFTV